MARFDIVVGVTTMLKKAAGEVSAFAGKASQDIAKIGKSMSSAAGTAALASFAGLSLALAGSAVAAVRFENEFANVKKTMSDVQDPVVFKSIQDDLVKLSTQIPIFAGELAQIATVGGQLGIGADDITQFTEVVAKLGGATNMSSEQAATGMARFLNVTNEQMDTIGKYASVLVELGNNTAATEGEILLLAQNFGATGEITGLATEEILAFSAAMRETGQQSQAGATALGKLFLNLSDAAKIGGKEMAVFAQVAGQDVHQFRRLIETDIGSAAQIFLGGLNRMTADGRSTTATLEELGLGTIRVQRALLSLANNEEGLAEARQRANKEAITQNALNEEAAQKFDTVAMQMQQFKSTMGAAAITLGQTLMPLLHALVKILVVVADVLFGLAQFFEDFPIVLYATMAALGILSTVHLRNVAKETSMLLKLGGKLKNLFLGIASIGGIVTVAVGAMALAYKKYRDDVKHANEVTAEAGNIMSELKVNLEKGFQAEPITENQWESFLMNLPDATRKALLKGVEEGLMGRETFDAITKAAPMMSEQFSKEFENLLDIDEGFFTGERSAVGKRIQIDNIIKEIEGAGLGGDNELGPLVDTLTQYRSVVGAVVGEQKELKEELEEILRVQFGIFQSVEAEYTLRDKDISKALNEHFEGVAKIDRRSASLMRTEAGRLKLARELASGPNGIQKFKDILGDVVDDAEDLGEEFEAVETNLDSLLRIVNDFRTQIDNLFAPTEAQFKAGMNERELMKAHKEHADLHKEQSDLTQEELDLAQEKIDLANKELATAEEKLEIQELENEALEIEKKIREGNAISADDFLKKEKLKKELARVNAAIAQGSLEFPEKERQYIQDQIDAIDEKALTQKDADDKRKKAQEIIATVEERRQERLAAIDTRRLEIQERLAEIPDEIYAKHYDIHKLQRDGVNAQLDMIQAQADFNTLKETELRMTAELLGLNMAQIDGMMTLMNHARVESGPMGQSYLSKLLQNLPILQMLLGYTQTNSATGPQMEELYDAFKSSGSSFGNMKPVYRHMGGNFKPGQNYVVGEYGPEMMKAFPGGGGMITPMGNRGGGDTINHVTLNVTGLPSDPIAARRTAQLIQKELNKLKSDGRSGIVR